MKKRIYLILVLVFLVNMLIVSCSQEVHTHTYSTEWTSDESGHWYSVICGCKDLKVEKFAHTFGDWHVTIEPTETSEGCKERKCCICNYLSKEVIEYIPNVDVENTCYTIIFNANGGSLTDNAIQKVMRGERIIAPSIPIREGYAFEGWYRSDDDGITLSGRKWIFTDKIRILVFCTEERIKEALDFGATYAGEEYIDKIKNGWFDFDIAVATPDMMKEVGRLGMSLGRQGLMPNPKTGTVTDDLESAIKKINNMFLISEDLTLYAKWKQE